MRDQRVFYAAAFLRALAVGWIGVALGIYLARLGLSAAAIGEVVSAGLAGAGMKIGYDLALYLAFRRLRPPEEGGAPSGG